MFVIFLLAQVSPATEETPRSPQGVELLFPADGGAVPKDKDKDAKAEKAAKRRTALLKKLKAIEEGGDINAADKKGQTALMLAAAANDRLAVCWLVAKGVNVSLKNKKGKTARDLSTSIAVRELLRLAANEKKPLTEEEKVRYHVDTKPTKDELQQSLSHAMPYVEDLANLIKMGAKPTAWDVDGHSLLENHNGAVPESIAWLARKGVDFAERGKDGKWTGGQNLAPAALRLLLVLGAKPDLQKDDPRSCLQVAMEKDDTPSIQAVLKKAPELAKKDWRDFLPYVHSKNAVKAFIAGGFDPKDEWVIPSFASSSESCEALAALFEAGVTLPSRNADSAMSATVYRHHGVFIPQLIAAGGDLNKDNSNLLGPAVEESDIQSLRILLAVGIKVSPESNPLNELFCWRGRGCGNSKSEYEPYMNLPSRGVAQESDWREYCEQVRATRDIIDVLSKAGCPVPNFLPCYYLDSYLPWGRHQCPDLPPSMVNMLGSPESPEKTVRELLKLSGNRIKEDALFAGPLYPESHNGNSVTSRKYFTTAELIRIANLFLDAGADPKFTKNNEASTLMAAGSLDAALCKRLLDAGANPKAEDNEGITALHRAINTGVAQVLLGAWSNIQEIEKKKSILSYYLETYDKHRDTLALCKFWKEHGANFDFDLSDIRLDGEYPAEELLEILRLLVGGENLASYRSQKTKESLLHAAAEARHEKLARLLLKTGVDVNAKDKDGETPLMRTSDQKTFKLLLQNGADINAQNNNGNTYLMHLIVGSPYVRSTRRQTLCRSLLDSGARTDIKNKDGKTALQLAREKKYDEIVKLLEAHGVKE